jgi:hypothetical protein
MTYFLRIYDNFHYMDESEAYNLGRYSSLDDAKAAADTIIIEFIEHNLRHGIPPEDLSSQWSMYGEEPVICRSDGQILPDYKARDELSSLIAKVLQSK